MGTIYVPNPRELAPKPRKAFIVVLDTLDEEGARLRREQVGPSHATLGGARDVWRVHNARIAKSGNAHRFRVLIKQVDIA